MYNDDNTEIENIVVTGINYIKNTDHVMLKAYLNVPMPEVVPKMVRKININNLENEKRKRKFINCL